MAKKSNATTTDEPKFRPSPEFAALEKEVERIKRRRSERGLEPLTTPGGDARSIASQIKAIRDRHGLKELTPAEEKEFEVQRKKDEQRQRHELEALRKEGRWNRLCPDDFREPFDFSKVSSDARREGLTSVLDWQFGPRGLYVIGATGHSKTRAVFAMLRREAIDKRRSVIAIDGIAFSTACSTAFRDSTNTEKWLRAMKEPDILFIDDLATRFTPATQEGFFGVLDARTKHKKPLILTTNCTGQMLEDMMAPEIRAHLADPLRRRLREYCQMCVV